MARQETPAPVADPILAGRQSSRSSLSAWRPRGVRDWVLILNQGGRAYYRHPAGTFYAGPGDAVLIAPHTPHDYGLDEQAGFWQNVWVHFRARPQWAAWLSWPQVAPGLGRLPLRASAYEGVGAALAAMEVALHTPSDIGTELAMNALERGLLLCADTLSRQGERGQDARVRRAVAFIVTHLHEPLPLARLAAVGGLSVSRFSACFTRALGETPARYVELQRLSRAGALLRFTNQPLYEIAEGLGFQDQFYFSRRFKHHYGESPSSYRRRPSRPQEHLGTPEPEADPRVGLGSI